MANQREAGSLMIERRNDDSEHWRESVARTEGMERDSEMREDTVSQREGGKRHYSEPHSQSVEPKEKRDHYLSR